MNRQEIETLIESRDRAFKSPRESLDSWHTGPLAVILAAGLVQTTGIIFWAIYDHRLSQAENIKRSFEMIKKGPHWLTLQAVNDTCKSESLLILLCDRLLCLDLMARELFRRPGPVGRALMNVSGSTEETFLKALQIESQDDDLRHESLLRFFESLQTMRGEANPKLGFVNIPLPEIFGARIPLSGPTWRAWPRIQAQILNLVLGYLGPILSGEVEKITEALQRSFRTHQETERRGARRHRALWSKHQVVVGETESDEDNQLERLSRNRAREDLVSVAQARWGEKTAKAVAYKILQGKTQKEAAYLAGIPYQSFRRKMSKLRRLGDKPKSIV